MTVVLSERANAWFVIALGIWLQALPFLVLGTALAAALTAFVPRHAIARLLPRRGWLAVPLAAAAGIALPACECGSVPTVRALTRAGVPQAAALSFMAASPAVNPVVIAATAMAYQAAPRMALARFLAGLTAATLLGLLWSRFGTPLPQKAPEHDHEHEGTSRWRTFHTELTHELLQSAGYLVIGAAAAATLKTVVPVSILAPLTANPVWQVVALAVLAVVVALCSEADAFMAVSLTAFSPLAQLVFLVVGPVVDVKLVAMQGGAFGSRFVARFVPLALACCLAAGVGIGLLVL